MNSHIRKLPMLEAAIYEASTAIKLELPFYASGVPAGFPSPADDYLDKRLDLNEHLIRNPAATFFVRVEGDSMIGTGINNGDLAIVDRSSDYRDGSNNLVRRATSSSL